MRIKVYKYTGTVSRISSTTTKSGLTEIDVVLYDPNDRDKAPTRLTGYGALADYILALEGGDDAERYIPWEYYFDDDLELAFAVIPSTDSSHPAKVLARSGWDDGLTVYGPAEPITTAKPEPMDWEEHAKASQWLHSRYEVPGRI